MDIHTKAIEAYRARQAKQEEEDEQNDQEYRHKWSGYLKKMLKSVFDIEIDDSDIEWREDDWEDNWLGPVYVYRLNGAPVAMELDSSSARMLKISVDYDLGVMQDDLTWRGVIPRIHPVFASQPEYAGELFEQVLEHGTALFETRGTEKRTADEEAEMFLPLLCPLKDGDEDCAGNGCAWWNPMGGCCAMRSLGVAASTWLDGYHRDNHCPF